MDPSLQASVSGIKAAQTRTGVRSHNIANINTDGFSGSRATQVEVPPGTRISSIDKADQDTVDDIATLKVTKHSHSANIRVAKVANKMLGTLLDLVG